MIPSQMLKGTLEGCILAIISKKETYGYEISEELNKYGFGKVAEGTIYPLLLRLEKNKSISAVFRQSEVGPKRKYYSLTDVGKKELLTFEESYAELSNAVSKLLRETGGHSIEQQYISKTTQGKLQQCTDRYRGLHPVCKYQRIPTGSCSS